MEGGGSLASLRKDVESCILDGAGQEGLVGGLVVPESLELEGEDKLPVSLRPAREGEGEEDAPSQRSP